MSIQVTDRIDFSSIMQIFYTQKFVMNRIFNTKKLKNYILLSLDFKRYPHDGVYGP